MSLQLRQYQIQALERLLYKGNIYQMIDMGLGKTVITLKAIEQVRMPTIVFAPLLAVYHTWVNEIKKWTPNLRYVILHGNTKDYRIRKKADIYLINYEGLAWLRQQFIKGRIKMQKYFVVWDESTMLKALPEQSKRSAMMDGMMPLWGRYRTALSATPAPNNLLDLWHQYYLLDKGKRLYDNFYRYRKKFFLYSGKPLYRTTLKAGSDTLIMNRVKDITVRVDAEDHLELPSIIYNYIKLPLPKHVQPIYNELKQEFLYEFNKGADYVMANSKAILGHKLRQLLQGGLFLTNTGKAKILFDDKAQTLKELCDNTRHTKHCNIIAAIQFSFEYQILCKVFKTKLPLVAGGIPPKKSIALLKQWNEGKIPLLIVHPASVSRSLNLQHGGHTVVWLASPWDFYHYHQLIGRLRRYDQKNKRVIVHHIVYGNTIDDRITRCLKRKQTLHELLSEAFK